MAREESAARADAMFGDYEIIETVGRGGMGVVYRAHDIALGRVVALKVLKEDLRSSRQLCARFQREAEAFASLNHANIVHIYTVGSVGRIPFISMEYIEGQPLSVIMKRRKRLPWKRALHIARQVTEALGCAHEAHIIHRDIKPGNVLIDKDDHAYVTDFGIAKVLTAETQLTIDGSRLGTPQYMSPERCMNKEITTSCDLYSVGVLTFQMISGRLPYEASSPVELIKRIVSDAPQRLSDFIDGVPEDVERLIAYAIEKKPRDRPESAHKLAELMQRVLEGKPLQEDESDLAGSLESFRESDSTPRITSTPHAEVPETWTQLRRRAAQRWAKVPAGARTIALGALIVALAAAAGFGIADLMDRGYAVDTVRSMNVGTESWNRSAVVADFMEESPGVHLARINLSSYRLSQAAFLGSNHVGIQTDSALGARGPRSALFVIDLVGRTAWLGISPKIGAEHQTAFTLLGASGPLVKALDASTGYLFTRDLVTSDGGAEPAVFASLNSHGASLKPQLLFQASNLLGMESLKTPTSIRAAVPNSAGDSLILALGAGTAKNAWSLIKYSPGEGGGRHHVMLLDSAGPPIEWIDTIPGDSHIRYVRRTRKKVFQLWELDETVGPSSRKLIYEGAGMLPKAALHPSGRRMILESASGPRASLRLIDLDPDSKEVDLGRGASAAWHPSGAYFIVTAPDRKGSLQLWAVRAEAPYPRAQLTFLAKGTSDLCMISADGAWAISSVQGTVQPVMAIVDVSERRLRTLEFNPPEDG